MIVAATLTLVGLLGAVFLWAQLRGSSAARSGSSMSQFVDTVQLEIAEEKAGTLGRTGQRLQAAVELLREHERSRSGSAHYTDAKRERLLWDVAERAESFVVQREACGLRDARQALAFYGVPREATRRIGAKRPKH